MPGTHFSDQNFGGFLFILDLFNEFRKKWVLGEQEFDELAVPTINIIVGARTPGSNTLMTIPVVNIISRTLTCSFCRLEPTSVIQKHLP